MNNSLRLFFAAVLAVFIFAVYGIITFVTEVVWPVSAPIASATVLAIVYCWFNVAGFSVMMKPGNSLGGQQVPFDMDEYVDVDDFE